VQSAAPRACAVSENGGMKATVVFCSCPDQASADRIASTLVEERLAACVNRLAGVVSTYRWRGTIQRDDEVLLLIKTTSERFDAVHERIVALHPHELPEVVAVDIARGLPAYLDWIAQETQP
jgi:periplasmic divalent cation tolerance protein